MSNVQLPSTPVIRAVIAALTGMVIDGTVVPVGDGEIRTGAEGARIAVSRIASAVPDGTMAQPYIDGSHSFDIACIGRTQGETSHMVDTAWAAVSSIVSFDNQVVQQISPFGWPGIFKEVDVEPIEYFANLRLQLVTTPLTEYLVNELEFDDGFSADFAI